MEAKLTLKMDEEVVEQAKVFAREKGTSLSRLVESYLRQLTSKVKDDQSELSPLVKSMTVKFDLPADFDAREDYRDFLNEKYK
jgi:hypothetical protein